MLPHVNYRKSRHAFVEKKADLRKPTSDQWVIYMFKPNKLSWAPGIFSHEPLAVILWATVRRKRQIHLELMPMPP